MPGVSCCTTDYDAVFSDRAARRELERYRRSGPTGATKRLIDALRSQGVEGTTLLDIGGGIGAIGHELLAAGATHATGVDFSRGYLAAARAEAERRGLSERSEHRYGDFVALADELEPADVVTLDAVICCYPDMPALVGRSVERARRLYGIVIPRDRWWLRLGIRLVNLGLRLTRNSYRAYVHDPRAIDRLVRSHGFERRFRHRGLAWETRVYRRGGTSAGRGTATLSSP